MGTYIGINPSETFRPNSDKDTFTGDGSTTVFDMGNIAPAGADFDVAVFVNNVRQEPGAGKSYTIGADGSGDQKRITFTVAPPASSTIYVINPGAVTQVNTVSDNAITVAKLASTLDLSSNTVTLPNDADNADKIADDSISEEHIDNTAITGFSELSAVADGDLLLISDASDSNNIKKIQKSNLVKGLTYASGTGTGDGSTTTLTINSGRSEADVLVVVNGILLAPTDYAISGTTLTFDVAPAASAQIEIRYLPI